MRSQPRTPRRMIPMHVVQGLDFVVAKRGNILHGECSHLSRSSRFMLSLPCKLFTLASRVSEGMRMSYETLCPSTYLVTHHPQTVDAVERVWRHVCADHHQLEHGPDYLLYLLLDTLTADYMPAIGALDDTLDELETAVFSRPTPHTLSTLFTVKRAVLHLRRIISPQREVLNKLARDDYTVIDPQDRVFFRDVYDHLVRLVDLNETLRDLTSGALDTYLSVTSNRINEVMKVLTIISALFMPISFVTGFFGMNFEGLPFANRWLMMGVLGTILMTPFLMLYWFTQRGWLSPSEPQYRRPSLMPEAAAEEPQSQAYRAEVASRKFHRQKAALGDERGGDL